MLLRNLFRLIIYLVLKLRRFSLTGIIIPLFLNETLPPWDTSTIGPSYSFSNITIVHDATQCSTFQHLSFVTDHLLQRCISLWLDPAVLPHNHQLRWNTLWRHMLLMFILRLRIKTQKLRRQIRAQCELWPCSYSCRWNNWALFGHDSRAVWLKKAELLLVVSTFQKALVGDHIITNFD